MRTSAPKDLTKKQGLEVMEDSSNELAKIPKKMTGVGTLLLVFGLLIFVGAGIFSLMGIRGAISGNRGIACVEAERERVKLDAAIESFNRAKAVEHSASEAQDELRKRGAIAEGWAKTCAEMNAGAQRSMVTAVIVTLFGFVLVVAGFLIRR